MWAETTSSVGAYTAVRGGAYRDAPVFTSAAAARLAVPTERMADTHVVGRPDDRIGMGHEWWVEHVEKEHMDTAPRAGFLVTPPGGFYTSGGRQASVGPAGTSTPTVHTGYKINATPRHPNVRKITCHLGCRTAHHFWLLQHRVRYRGTAPSKLVPRYYSSRDTTAQSRQLHSEIRAPEDRYFNHHHRVRAWTQATAGMSTQPLRFWPQPDPPRPGSARQFADERRERKQLAGRVAGTLTVAIARGSCARTDSCTGDGHDAAEIERPSSSRRASRPVPRSQRLLSYAGSYGTSRAIARYSPEDERDKAALAEVCLPLSANSRKSYAQLILRNFVDVFTLSPSCVYGDPGGTHSKATVIPVKKGTGATRP